MGNRESSTKVFQLTLRIAASLSFYLNKIPTYARSRPPASASPAAAAARNHSTAANTAGARARRRIAAKPPSARRRRYQTSKPKRDHPQTASGFSPLDLGADLDAEEGKGEAPRQHRVQADKGRGSGWVP